MAAGGHITSTNAALNVILRSCNEMNTYDEGYVDLNGVTINTNGGHLWIGGSGYDAQWNGLTVGNSSARIWLDNIAGIKVLGCTLNSNGGHIYLSGMSFDTYNNGGTTNYGIDIDNSTITSGAGNIELKGQLFGRYAIGSGVFIGARTGNININATTGTISIVGEGYDTPNNDNSTRLATYIAVNAGRTMNIGTTTGSITISGSANFGNSTVNDAEGLLLSSGNTAKSLNITSQSGNITLSGTNTRANTGQFCNGIRMYALDVTNAIYIGDDGVNPYTGNITISADAFLQRVNNTGSGSIALKTTGTITFQPQSNSFTHLRAGNSPGTLTFDNDWDFGTTATAINIGKTTNTFGFTLSNAIAANGPINIYSGALTLNGNLSTSNGSTGDILIKGTSLSGSGTMTVPSGKNVTLDLSGNSTTANVISGSGVNIIKAGAGALTLSAASGYTGSTTVNAGTLQFNENKAFNAITIANGATLALGPNKQFDLNSTFANNGTLNLKSGATILHGGSNTISGTGSYVVEQAITGSNSGGTPNGRFWYLGSPVTSVSSSVFFGNAANVLKKRNETNNTWVAITNAAPENLEVGKGYYTQATTSSTISFTGSALNNGAISISGLTRTAGIGFEGFNLVSNPYPSYLDWDAVTKTDVGNTMWYRTFNSTNNTMVFDTYVAGTGGIGTNLNGAGVSNLIPPMQSFWVRVNSGSATGSLGLTNSMRAHFTSINGSTAGLKSTSNERDLFLRMNLMQADKKDQLIVYVNQTATNGFDVLDGEKMMQAGMPQFYTSAAGKKITINGLNSAKKQQALPITMELPTTGVHSFVIEDLEISNGLVWLEDKQEEIMQALEPGTVYEFYANSGINAERFVLHFQLIDDATPINVYNEVNGSANFSGKGASVHAESAGVVVIKLPVTTEGVTDIQIRDAAGRLVYTGSTNTLETSVQLAQANGIYYVTLNSASGVEVRKVFVQQ
jgi:autotransporter-associated beta strand protein